MKDSSGDSSKKALEISQQTSSAPDKIPVRVVEQIYDYLPALLLHDARDEDVANRLGVSEETVLRVKTDFIQQIGWASGSNQLSSVVGKLSEYAKSTFLIQAFKNTKKFGVLWEGCLEKLDSIDLVLKGKLKKLTEDFAEDPEEVTIKELKEVMALSANQQKQILELIKSSPFFESIAQHPVGWGGVNVNFVNNAGGKEESRKEIPKVFDTSGLVEPPEID